MDRLQDLLAIWLPFLAKVSFQILLTRPAANDEDEDRVELTLYFLRLAPWIVRPGPRRNHDGGRALPLPRVRLHRRGHHGGVSEVDEVRPHVGLQRLEGHGLRHVEVALPRKSAQLPRVPHVEVVGQVSQRLHFPRSSWPTSAQRGGRLLRSCPSKKKAIWNPQNEDHRCFMWCVLAHCLGVEGLNKHQRSKAASCSGSFFYPELAGRRGSRADPLWPTLGWPADGPTPGGWRSSSSCGSRPCGRTGWSTTASSSRAARASRAASPAQRPLQPDPQLQAGAGRPTNTAGCAEYKCPRCMARFTAGLVAAPPRHPALSRDSRAHLESAAARAQEDATKQGLRRARAPDVLRGP